MLDQHGINGNLHHAAALEGAQVVILRHIRAISVVSPVEKHDLEFQIFQAPCEVRKVNKVQVYRRQRIRLRLHRKV